MKAIVVDRIGSFTIRDVLVPEPGPNEILVKVKVTGLCRTDLKLIRSGHRDLILPRIPGEEVVGEIVKAGKGVTINTVGERVYVYPGIWCGTCSSCNRGAFNLCQSMRIMGFHRDGGFAEYVCVPQQSVIFIDKEMSYANAVFAEPLSCCLNAIELSQLAKNDTVGIWGAGPAGTLLARIATLYGAEVSVIEPHENRRKYCNGFKSVPDRLFDVCIIAVGNVEAYKSAIEHLQMRGRLIIFSGLLKHEEHLQVNMNRIHYHEQTITGAYGCSYRHGVAALKMLHNNPELIEGLVSHRLPLEKLADGLSIVEERSGMKVLLYPEGDVCE